MSGSSTLVAYGGIALGAVVASAAGYATTRASARTGAEHQRAAQANDRAFEAALAFSTAARRLWHAADELVAATATSDQQTLKRRCAEAHGELRTEFARIRLVGSADVQRCAREVQREATNVRRVSEGEADQDPDPDHPDEDAFMRMNRRLRDFFVAARTQLGTPDPGDVPELDPRFSPPAVRVPRRAPDAVD